MQITLENITKIYGGSDAKTTAVSDIALNIAPGEFFFLLGPSGCGKTTLLRIIAGLIMPTKGKVLFNSKDVTDLPVDKRNAAMVFQGYALWPHMTVRQNVEFGPKMQGIDKAGRKQMADAQLTRVELSALADRKPNQLSGGQQQRVALARALAAKSDCLLLDEPLSNLDARLRLHMRTELRDLVKVSGITAVYVTHDQKEALSMADRIAVMDKGRIVQVGTPEQVYNCPDTLFVADFLGEANFIQGTVAEAGAPAKIHTAYGDLLAADSKGLKSGTPVTCCVRPEQIALVPYEHTQFTDEATLFDAAVKSIVYLGDTTQYICQLHGAQSSLWKVSALSNGAAGFKQGQTVNIRIPSGKVTLLKK